MDESFAELTSQFVNAVSNFVSRARLAPFVTVRQEPEQYVVTHRWPFDQLDDWTVWQNHLRETEEKYDAWKASAKARAKKLLFSYLTLEQQMSWTQNKHFEDTLDGSRFRFYGANVSNVYLMEGDRRVASYCIAPVGNLPIEDVVLAQWLLLKCDPAEFFRKANGLRLEISGGYGPTTPGCQYPNCPDCAAKIIVAGHQTIHD